MQTRRGNAGLSSGPAPAPAGEDSATMSASRRVCRTPELWRYILKLADRTTLARVLRLERTVTASVAEVLYARVTGTVMRGMSRSPPRRAVYCDAVLALDTSPRPDASDPHRWGAFAPAIKLDAEKLLRDIKSYRRKFPNLHTIHHRYPRQQEDDAYTVYLDGDSIAIDLQTRIEFHQYNFPSTPPVLPPNRTLDGMAVRRHTYIVAIEDQEIMTMRDRVWPTSSEMTRAWLRWMYCNPNLDGRVTGVDHHRYSHTNSAELSLDDITTFLTSRQEGECQPLTEVIITDAEGITLPRFAQIAAHLGAGLRVLQLPEKFFDMFEDLQTGIALLDGAVPKLEDLTLRTPYSETRRVIRSFDTQPPLYGMPHLIRFNFLLYTNGAADTTIARFIHQIGSDDCVYHVSHLASQRAMREFSNLVRDMKVANRKASVHAISW